MAKKDRNTQIILLAKEAISKYQKRFKIIVYLEGRKLRVFFSQTSYYACVHFCDSGLNFSRAHVALEE